MLCFVISCSMCRRLSDHQMCNQWVRNLLWVWWRLQYCLSLMLQGLALYCPGSTCKVWIFYIFLGTCWNIQLRGCKTGFGFGNDRSVCWANGWTYTCYWNGCTGNGSCSLLRVICLMAGMFWFWCDGKGKTVSRLLYTGQCNGCGHHS